jgi:hypothetical protein
MALSWRERGWFLVRRLPVRHPGAPVGTETQVLLLKAAEAKNWEEAPIARSVIRLQARIRFDGEPPVMVLQSSYHQRQL